MQNTGEVVLFEKFADCPETGDQRIRIVVELSSGKKKEFFLYVGHAKHPRYQGFEQRSMARKRRNLGNVV